MSNAAIGMTGLLESEYFDLESGIVGDVFRIFVAKPAYLEDRGYPAIFVADGNGSFPMAMSIQRMLHWGAQAPAAYVIGIGYPTERGYLQAIANRNRDYVPTDGGDYAKAILGMSPPPGAGNFLRFLNEELKPELARRYSIDADDSTFIGSSLGGLFGAWTLLTEPDTFNRYILASPAISWNNEEVWQWEQTAAVLRKDLQATVFVSAGTLESATIARKEALTICENNPALRERVDALIEWCDQHGWPRTDELPREFAARLRSRNYPGLKIHAQIMPDETHMSVSSAVISRGLRYVFEHWQPDTTPVHAASASASES
jgi:uncharacterized protein